MCHFRDKDGDQAHQTLVRKRPDPPPDTVLRQWDKTHSCYGSRQTLTSPSDCVLCLIKIVLARFLSHATRCAMVTSVCLSYDSARKPQVSDAFKRPDGHVGRNGATAKEVGKGAGGT